MIFPELCCFMIGATALHELHRSERVHLRDKLQERRIERAGRIRDEHIAARKQIVEIEMQLKDAAVAVSRETVRRNDRFGADLKILARPDDAGLDTSGFVPRSAS
jgi:hypothetical protein